MRFLPAKGLALAAVALLLTGGCAANVTRWPGISESPTDVHIPGRWVWEELITDNVEVEKTFYREVFGWGYESYGTVENAYTLVRVEGRPIAGIIHSAKPAGSKRSARWLPLMSVSDARRATEKAAASGGKVLVPPKEFPGRGVVAVLEDPEGALFGIIHSSGGDPPDVFPPYNSWLWVELWASDRLQMAEFYRPIGGYTITRAEDPGDRPEVRLVAGGYPRAAILEFRRTDVPSTWLPYVRVEDLQTTLARVTQAGGRIVISPSVEIRDGKVAVILDPLGAALAVAEWRDENGTEERP